MYTETHITAICMDVKCMTVHKFKQYCLANMNMVRSVPYFFVLKAYAFSMLHVFDGY